ncbi:microtubule-associated protein 1B-like isoform X2 [Liolophura sinensis]|uniref:microtubule-associated protein 1B-like isoform X2 n=1 Tax=Liolophura sinensis TaxID=3198878 RepID=UPI0031592A96
MATELAETMHSGDSVPAAKAAVLLVIGEPVSNGHKDLILGEISKGFLSWDLEGTGVDINEELASIANAANAGEEGPEGERVIRRSSPDVQVEILVNPQTGTVKMGLKTFLTTPSQHKHLIYAGHGFQGSGAWVLQDDIFTFTKFVQVFRDPDVENALKQQQGGSLTIHCFADGEWSNGSFAKQDFGKILKVSVNPEGKLSDTNGILRFVTFVSNFVEGRSLNKLLQASDVVGNIRFSKPTLYVFPGCQGDSALFGISGFNLLINGGYNRKACFWDFTRHLDRIDAMLLTHLGPDNLFGIGSVLERKAVENVHPEIGYVYLNAGEKTKHSPNGDLAPEEGGLLKSSTLKINLGEECSRLIEYCKQIGQTPHPCTRSAKGDTLEPINLYHKVGHGSLDMYVLNPVQDSKEIKEYFQQFSKHVGQFGLSQGLPLQNVLSTCVLLVWKPANPKENITRILFPGNAPQNKVIEGLEKVKNLDFLKHAKCCDKDLHAKPGRKGALSSKAGRPASAKPPAVSSPRESLRKEKLEKVEKPKMASTLKANKGIKEDSNKKAVKEKKERQKPAKSAVTNGTSAGSSTPSGTPGRDVSPPSDTGVLPVPAMEGNLIDIQPEPAVSDEPASAGGSSFADDSKAEAEQDFQGQLAELSAAQQPMDGNLDSPEPLPDPANYQPDTVLMPEKAEETMAMVDEQVAMSKKTMEELGIYDEDAEFPEDGVHELHETAVVNNHEGNFEKAEDEDPEEDIGAFENDNPEAEEIQPEALPEPIAIPACYGSDSHEIHAGVSDAPMSEEAIKSQDQPEQQAFTSFSENVSAETEVIPQETEAEEQTKPTDEAQREMFDSEHTPPHSPDIPDHFTPEASEIEDSLKAVDTSVTEGAPTTEQTDFLGREECYSPEVGASEDMSGSAMNNFDLVSDPSIEVQEPSMEGEEPSIEVQEPSMEVQEPSMEGQEPSIEGQEPFIEVQEPSMEGQEPSIVVQEPSMEVQEPVKEDDYADDLEPLKEDQTVREEMEAAKDEESLKEDDVVPEEEEEIGFENEYDEGEAIEQQHTTGVCNAGFEASESESFQAEPVDQAIADQMQPGQNPFESTSTELPQEQTEESLGINEDKQSDAFEDNDNAESSIPAAFEKDETPTRAELIGSQDAYVQEDTSLYPDSDEAVDPRVTDDLPKNFQQKEETDSLDGEPDDEKDVDEACIQEGLEEQPEQVLPENGSKTLTENPFAVNDKELADNAAAAQMEQGGMNPFFGIDDSDKQMSFSSENPFADNLNQDAAQQPFNPLKEWGEPMGLPSPMMEEAASNKSASDKSSKPKPTKSLKNGSPKTADAKTAKKPDPKKATPSRAPADKKSSAATSKTQKLVNGESKTSKSLLSERKTTQKVTNTLEKKTPKASSRPISAPARSEPKRSADNGDVSKAKATRRPATASGNRTSAPSIKTIPLPAVTPYYVDLTYIPAHGDPSYSDVELFRRVRARYYVLSALSPTSQTLNSLMEAKRTWEDSNLEVTVIPTYDNETLRHWMGLHKDELNELKIDVAPAASRCTIQLVDQEASCSAYRLEF